LLKGEDGAKNLKDAEALFDGKLEGFIKENPELAKFLVPSGLEHMKELQLKLEKLVKLQEKLRALQLKASELNEKHYALKKEVKSNFFWKKISFVRYPFRFLLIFSKNQFLMN